MVRNVDKHLQIFFLTAEQTPALHLLHSIWWNAGYNCEWVEERNIFSSPLPQVTRLQHSNFVASHKVRGRKIQVPAVFVESPQSLSYLCSVFNPGGWMKRPEGLWRSHCTNYVMFVQRSHPAELLWCSAIGRALIGCRSRDPFRSCPFDKSPTSCPTHRLNVDWFLHYLQIFSPCLWGFRQRESFMFCNIGVCSR